MNRPVVRMLACLLLVAAVTGCDKMADTSQAAQEVVKTGFYDTKSSWLDFFTYHPSLPTPLPQTRYCYQMQTDIVCYDREQSTMTSKLIGYQDGENISWVQPGGGSLGVSGGEAIALRPLPAKKGFDKNAPNPANLWGLIRPSAPADTSTVAVLPPSTGQISVSKLPPITATKK